MAYELEDGFRLCPTPDLKKQDPVLWASLILDSASFKAESVAGYYSNKRIKKKFLGRIIQFVIMISAFATGIIPILPILIEDPKSVFIVSPVWGSVTVLVTGIAVSFDNYYGYRSASVRFLSAERKLQTLIDEFQYERINIEVSKENELDDNVCAQRAAETARKLIRSVNEIVNQETEEWQKEIKGAIKTSLPLR